MAIKLKTGACPDCTDGKEKPLISGRCQNHYWKAVADKSAAKTGGIKKVSKKQAKRIILYKKGLGEKRDFDDEFIECEMKVKCKGARATDNHHPAGRTGDNLFDETIKCCRKCHDWAEENPEQAKEIGVSKSRLIKQ